MNRIIKHRGWNGDRMIPPAAILDNGAWATTGMNYENGNFLPPETLMRSTGFFYPNGEDIFEDDIIQFSYKEESDTFGIVRFSTDGFWTSQPEGYHENLLSEELETFNYKKAGTIHENPDLAKRIGLFK